MHFEREARDIVNHLIDKNQLNLLFTERKFLAERSINTGEDQSFNIQVINNKIKTLLCLR